ncbi:hypothetical protein C943_03248 [Mariniradius saccharolyticus AK6]|uniref:Uncharacterized protein n=1 Tax=Mariniradius saccharolyticus AK6 TaxID=1239962 RepID=M7YCN7_9BACT|nr:hypothetical protein C943_03248 [Mariniradius saccharolyticus AK6]
MILAISLKETQFRRGFLLEMGILGLPLRFSSKNPFNNLEK